VFDIDGVLVEVMKSYREAIRETVLHFTGELVSQDEIQDFKNAGGWNNDWRAFLFPDGPGCPSRTSLLVQRTMYTTGCYSYLEET